MSNATLPIETNLTAILPHFGREISECFCIFPKYDFFIVSGFILTSVMLFNEILVKKPKRKENIRIYSLVSMFVLYFIFLIYNIIIPMNVPFHVFR